MRHELHVPGHAAVLTSKRSSGKFQIWWSGKRRKLFGYVPVEGGELFWILDEIATVRDKFEFIVPPDEPWALDVRLKNELDTSPLWLLEEAYPAVRFFSESK